VNVAGISATACPVGPDRSHLCAEIPLAGGVVLSRDP
jgi:hypothetical protein